MALAAALRIVGLLALVLAFGSIGDRAKAQPAPAASPQPSLAELLRDYKIAEGAALAEHGVTEAKAKFGTSDPRYAAALNWLGLFRQATSRYAEAEELHREARTIVEKALGPDHVDVAVSLENLGLAYDRQGRTADAEPLFVRALAIREAALGRDHPLVADSLSDLGMLYTYGQARYGEAEPVLKRAYDIREKALGSKDLATAISLLNLAKLSHERGNFTEADQLYGRALVAMETAVGKTHPEVARALLNLATLHGKQGRYTEAESHLRRALTIFEQTLGPNDERVGLTLNGLASLYRLQGRLDEAEPLVTRSLEIQEKLLGSEHPDIARTLTNLAALNRAQQRFGKSEALLLRALAIREKRFGPDNPEVGITLTRLAGLYLQLGRNNEAESLVKRAMSIRQKALGERHADVGLSTSVLAGIYEKKGEYEPAEATYLKALDIQEGALGPNHPEVATTKSNLGGLYKARGRLSEAQLFLQSALLIRERTLPQGHPAVIDSLVQMAELYRMQGQLDEARTFLDRARALAKSGLREVPVYFGTDRRGSADPRKPSFGNERAPRGQVTTGLARVTVPQLLKKADASAAARDESTDVSRIAIQQVAIESGDAFTASIDRALLASKIFHRRAFIFIHGYNVSFENAVRRAGQIAFDLDFDGPAFLFSWPSRGQILGYLADRDEVDVTAEHLKQFLKTYVLASKVESLHIVAHSMGNMVLLRAIEKMREDNSIAALPLGEIVTAAPDVDPDLYSQFVAKVASTGAHVTLYMSADDRALWLSSWLRGRPRAGFVLGAPSAIAGTETIDITGVPSVSWFALNHDVYASTPLIVGDMRGVFLGERPPDRRTKEFSRVDLGAQVFWKYRTEPKVER